MKKRLQKIYDVDVFRKHGHELVDQLSSLLESSLNKEITVNNYKEPEERYQDWKAILEKGDLSSFYQELISDSIHLHHPHYIGHQISPPAPLAALSGLAADFLNNGMGVYEMGGPATALEKLVIETISQAIGYDPSADGFLTSGGTLANLTALLTARAKIADSAIWSNGYRGKKYAIMVSSQAHYCVDRAARIMGLGEEGIIKIPVNDRYEMDTALLEKYYAQAVEKEVTVFAIVGSACSTATGSYDNIAAIADFAIEHNIWFHIDGAHGGAAVFSEKYRHLLQGIAKADSVIVDCHKMMMTPALATAVIYRHGDDSYATFSQHAQYLFDRDEQEWHNLAKRTFECTKFMMSVKFATILMVHGPQGIGDFVTTLYDLGRKFAELIRRREKFELAHNPSSNIVCYRLSGNGMTEEEKDQLNASTRARLLQEGKFYIVQTTLKDRLYLRSTIMNPFTTETELEELLDYLENIAFNR